MTSSAVGRRRGADPAGLRRHHRARGRRGREGHPRRRARSRKGDVITAIDGTALTTDTDATRCAPWSRSTAPRRPPRSTIDPRRCVPRRAGHAARAERHRAARASASACGTTSRSTCRSSCRTSAARSAGMMFALGIIDKITPGQAQRRQEGRRHRHDHRRRPGRPDRRHPAEAVRGARTRARRSSWRPRRTATRSSATSRRPRRLRREDPRPGGHRPADDRRAGRARPVWRPAVPDRRLRNLTHARRSSRGGVRRASSPDRRPGDFLRSGTGSLSVTSHRIVGLTARCAGPAGPTRLEHIT